MGNAVFRTSALAASIVAATAGGAPARAQSATAAGARSTTDAAGTDTIVVTATRSGDPIARKLIGSSVTVIDAAAFAARDTRIVSDILRDVPGVAVSRGGAIGNLTQVRIRGTEGNHVLVFIDGIKASDPYQGEFDFGTLGSDGAARIEVLRGQQSALYGSDAIGGVINYITLSGREAPGVQLRGEGGSLGTVGGSARVAGVVGNLDYALSGTGYHTDGYVTAAGGKQKVGSNLAGASGKVNWAPAPSLKITAVGRYNYTCGENNAFGANAFLPKVAGRTVIGAADAPGQFYKNNAYYALIRAELTSFGDAMTTAASAQVADTRRNSFAGTAFTSGDTGRRFRGSLENTVRFSSDRVKNRFTLAIDAEREQFRNTSPGTFIDRGRHTLDTLGFVAQYNLTVDDRLALGGSVRIDRNDFFNDDTTYHVEGSYLFGSGTRIHGAGGTGVKDPGAFELFGYSSGLYIGNPTLRPEKSKGWEGGVDQSFADSAVTVGATYFKSRLVDEIYTDYPPPTYIASSLNRTTVTRQEGVETFVEARLGDLRVDASYTYLHARQFRTVLATPTATIATAVSAQAVRRPKTIASANLSWTPKTLPITAALTVRYNGRQNDVAFTPGYSALYVALPAYTLVNLNLGYRLNAHVELFARAENLLDRTYEEVFSYAAPRRAVYGGAKLRL